MPFGVPEATTSNDKNKINVLTQNDVCLLLITHDDEKIEKTRGIYHEIHPERP